MKHTNSGALAVGAPNSLARIVNEAVHASEKQAYHLLMLTDEGRLVLDAALRSCGCGPVADMEGGPSDMIERYYLNISNFISGLSFAFHRI